MHEPNQPEGAPRSRRGRPRKWASDAERAAAYRARKAAELADADGLRRDRRVLRRRLTAAENARDRAQRAAEASEADAVALRDELRSTEARVRDLVATLRQLQDRLERLRQERDDAHADVARLTAELQAARTDRVTTSPATAPEPSLNRAQRRALDRRSGRRR